MFFKAAVVAAAVGTAVAQRPTNTSICDYYTTALLMNNTAANQLTLLTLVVNTAVIGNYTTPNTRAVAGILAAGEVDGVAVNLLPYFSGGLASTNTGDMAGRAVNFLDGGGAAPLKENKPATDENSRQYRLLTHLYSYFGALLGCTQQGGDFPAYAGDASQYEVHKFMALNNAEVTYFIQQVGASAESFGVAADDITVVATALSSLFGVKCAPETTVIPAQGAQLQSICIAEDCPLSPNATCDAYAAVVEPAEANATSSSNTSASASASATGSAAASASASKSASATGSSASPSGSTPATTTNSGAVAGLSFAAVAAGLAAMFL